MNSSPRRSRGFTFIEMLTVITIIAFLVVLLLPAVQAVREATRRSYCVNNLMQIATALQHYQNVHEVLPPGVANDTALIQNVPRGYHHGWMIQLLPFLEAKNVARRFNNRVELYAAANTTVRAMGIGVFFCPSDTDSGPPTGVVQTSYAACHNDVEAPIGARDNGTFFLNSHVCYEDILDGTSNTIFVGEKRRFTRDLGWASGTRATLRNMGIPINSPDLVYGDKPISMLLDDEQAVDIDPDPTNPNLVGGFNSWHPGGANFAFGDGAVRYLRQSTSVRVRRSLANRADGELPIDY